ncbi:glutathione peroxidase [Rheinheimera sp. UJ51]|uniref:glutathione peroxidase n=1 Tax=unclassified Rheinheimera TaxID=115860 RepID=UPI001E4BBE72|nr:MULTISPECIES: glutathione peroxidase [unclassified Rheinheimera]MCC5452957.1 glutathione peroxidase [Rheinheimera sp. UJ51]MCF4009021.1 glutathione peroxidase [Rheinheimera sp. UJ63]
MKKTLNLAAVLALTFSVSSLAAQCGNILGHSVQQLKTRESVDLCDEFKGKTLIVVNTASKCGFTPQFEALETLYQNYKDQGLVVLGFPSNDFRQEHSDEEKTAEVCYLTYGVEFPMFSTSSVRGDNANPVFKALIAKTGESPSWNFNKYIVSKDEQQVVHFGSRTSPDDPKFIAELEKLLAAK